MESILASWAHPIYGDGQLYTTAGSPHGVYTVSVNGTRAGFSLHEPISAASRQVLARFLTHLAAARRDLLGGYTYVTRDQSLGNLASLVLSKSHQVRTESGGDLLVHADTAEPPATADFFAAPPTAAEIERAVAENSAYRRVLYTAPDRSLQLVAMNADPLIPREVHDDTAQYFLVKHGTGVFEIDGRPETVERASARWVMPGQQHMIKSSTQLPLKVFVTYVPAHHPAGRIDQFNTDLLDPSTH